VGGEVWRVGRRVVGAEVEAWSSRISNFSGAVVVRGASFVAFAAA